MAVNNCIEKIKIGSTVEANIASTAYTTCSTRADVASKEAALDGFTLITGVTIHVKFFNSNTAFNPTLNVNSTGAISIKMYGNASPGITEESSWSSGSVISLTYDGLNWIMNDNKLDKNISNIIVPVEENGFFVADNSGQIMLKVNEDGLDFAKISNHAISILNDVISSGGGTLPILSVEENGVYYVDKNLNIGSCVDNNGVHAPNILEFEFVD